MTKKPEYDLVQLEKEHTSILPLLTQLDQEIDHQLAQLLYRNVSLAFPVQHRVKSWASIAEKLERVSLSLGGVRDLQDLVGFRIVLQFTRDVDRVCSLVEKNFKIVDRYDTVKRLKEDQFGYSSVHFLVELPEGWLGVPTMAGLDNLKAEIQVRTTAQHIWAEASQTLQYKNEGAVPPELRRAIYRVSALLETVDLEFERVLSARDSYRSEVAQSPAPSEPLNVDTLQQILDASWPKANKSADGENYADLLSDLNTLGVTTSDALIKVILKRHHETLAEDAKTVKDIRNDPKRSAASKRERIEAGVFFAHVGLTLEFPDEWRKHTIGKFQTILQKNTKS